MWPLYLLVLIPTPRVGSKCTQIKIYNKKPCTPVTFDFDFLTISSKNAWYQKFILCKRSSRPKIFQDGIFLKFFIRDKRNYDTMTIFYFWIDLKLHFGFFGPIGPQSPKNPKCSYKKSSITKSGGFIITYLAPIKKFKKFKFWKFLDL